MQSFNRILRVSSYSLILVIIIGFVGFSEIVKFAVQDQTSLKKRNLMRKFYLKLPFPLHFHVYFFNISNPWEVQQGLSPVVKEVGPYCYDAYKEKIEVTDNAGEDSLTYTPYETYFWNQERSGELSQNDYVTILHPLIVGMVNAVSKDSPPFLPVVNQAIKAIFNNPQNIYYTVKVRDILFDGIEINCNVQGFAPKAVCAQIKSQVPDLNEIGKNLYKFSLLGPRNGTLPNRFKILRGIKKSQELGRLVELNHQKEGHIWATKKCNRYHGTDGWIFAPYIKKEAGIWVHTVDLCRNIHIVYAEETGFEGISGEAYHADLGDMSRNAEDKCYCPSPKTCLPKGVMDLTKCMGVPILATLPHFLRVNEDVQKQIVGLHPETEKHIIELVMQPMLGVPLKAAKRLQFNLAIQSNKKIDIMQTLPAVIHPLLWVEESVALEGSLLKMVQAVFVALKVVEVLKYCLLGGSVVGVGYGGYLHYKNRRAANRVAPAPAASASSGSGTQGNLDQSEKNSAMTVKKDDFLGASLDDNENNKF